MQLSRAIGFFHGNIFLFSTTIGAGIFISPKGVLKSSSGNIPVSLSIWALCGILNIVNGLCAAETGATFPRSAAVYFLLKRTLGSCVAFLHVWIKLFGYFIGLAAQSLLVASSLIQPFYAGCSPPELPKKCLALAILWSLGLLNIRGVKTVSWFQTLSSLVKVAILCFISLAGIVLLVMGRKENVSRFESALDAELPDASQIAEAILQGFYPYVGSTVLVNIAGEVKNPSRTIPRSLISALSIVTVIYLLTNISYLTVLTPKEIISSANFQKCTDLEQSSAISQFIIGSDSVAATWVDRVLPSMQWVVSLGISASVIDTSSCGILSGSRLLYAAWLPMIFVSLVSSAFLIFMPIIQSPKMEHIYQVVFVLSGVLYYRLHVHLNQHSVFSEKITCYLQLLFNMSPSEDQQNCISTEKHGL
ncbi:PREDICTED: solute carrier family 7 member 13-like isoform X4 [Chinchilla lanigera]|uniref:Solute carrier family 7 member 13-like n=1 Tax=Chinchilla lanigera TaxID=34839 RepID=A0A8C2V2K8_CHILA|nr:PREDICTED: solute carrier family 7 member 13-like isoform X4 [Chinchilla lanigera]